MKKSAVLVIAAVILIPLIVIGATLFGSYNSLVSLNENVESSRSDIQTQLQRRNDLIPNLVNTVKGYASHEEEILTGIADARARLMGGGSMAEMADADAALSSALGRLLTVVESYPDLKADTQFTALMDELAGTENRIAVSRKNYNGTAREYNEKIRRFPTVFVANMFGFDRVDYFEASEGAQTPPSVDFGS